MAPVRLLLCLLLGLAACDGGGDPDFALIAPDGTVTLVRGQQAMIDVGVDRSGGFDDTVVVSAGGLVAGITPSAVSVRPDQDGGVLLLVVETSATVGPIDGAFLVGVAGEMERTAPLALTVE